MASGKEKRVGLDNNLKLTSVELLGGTIGGVMQAFIGHPLDVIKTRLQSGGYGTTSECVKLTMKHEGVRGFYKGVSSPLVGSCILNAALFGINGTMRRLLSLAVNKPVEEFRIREIMVSSIMTAPVYVAVLTPFELVKCQLASHTKGSMSPFTAIRTAVKERGFMGLFRGYFPTTCMRVVGLPAYFGANETSKMILRKQSGDRELGFSSLLFCGGMGGVGFWTVCYPFDLIKTRVQLSNEKSPFINAVRAIYRNRGIGGFYQGFFVCILRSFPANAVVFFSVDLTKRIFLENQ
mmetsp:Transcript_6226/g.8258  ORF Transcript_6226/g.8258 Transcript_6226/m.8258 type:complete len:293 (+) Transcript_6226:101-979(+)